jgi:DNA-binding YbaB/EbfC family protein
MKSMSELLKKAKSMQDKMQSMKEQLDKTIITGQSGNGMVKITLNGKYECLSTEISPEALKEDASVLSDLVTAAHRNAFAQMAAIVEKNFGNLGNDFNLPEGLF